MYRFLMPKADGTTIDIAIGADNLTHAFELFREFWWTPEMNRSMGVWLNAALIAVVMPVVNEETGELEPVIELIPRY